MPDPVPRNSFGDGTPDRIRLEHMKLAARDVVAFAAGRRRAELDSDAMLRRAIAHGVQEIGEAAAKVSPATRAALPSIPWTKIVGMRHILVHVYHAMDHDALWKVASIHAPELLAMLDEAIGP